jgi:uncharacterized coiled-coil protein SlyX
LKAQSASLSPSAVIAGAEVNEDTLERLESKISFLERANTELSDVVYRQQREIAGLQQQLALLKDRVEGFEGAQTSTPGGEEKPPHY